MKPKPVLWLALVIASGPLVLTAHARDPVIASRRGGDGQVITRILLPKQTLRSDIALLIGLPDAHLTPDVWVYWNYESNHPNKLAGHDTLLITFRRDRVVRMQVVEGASVRKYLAEREARPAVLQGPVYTAQPTRRK